MSRLGTIARRTFLIGSAAIAGGVAFGVYAYKREPENPLLRQLGDGQVALTPYVRIDQTGVTIITPRADVGQGVASVLAALVAEELDVAWNDIRIDFGPPSAAYYNGVVTAEGLPFAATNDGLIARQARVVGDAMSKFLSLQITGGSSTVPDAYEKMRVAGAVARDVLLQAAAKRTGIAKEELKTSDGSVITPRGEALSYASLAADAARIDPPKDVRLKPEAEWRYLGKPMQRIDIVAKSTGTATFGIDIKMSGMVYATARTNPRIGGGIKGFDASAAEKSRGVIAIVPITSGVGVIADNTWRAFKAASLIKCDWGPSPYPSSSATMFQTVAASFTAERQDSRLKDDGDVETALQGANVLEAEYKVPYLAHAPLEPMNAVVQLKDGRLDIWTGTQIPLFVLAMAAEVTGLRTENIYLHSLFSGGSFGRRLEHDYVRQAVELAKAHQGRPIKMTWTREEDMSHDFPRPLGIARMRGAVKDGKVEAYDLRIACPSVTASWFGRLGIPTFGPDTAIVAGAWDQPYRIPHYRVTGYRAPEMVPVSSWRSVLETVGKMSNWGSDPGKDRGRGIAFTLSFGVPVAEVVEVTNTPRGIKIDKVFVAADVGKELDPENFENQVQGGVIWGLGHAINCELTYKDGVPEQTNFHAYEALRLYQTPVIEVRATDNGSSIRGIGEPPVPPAAPALANAIFAATGKRIRELPLNKHIDFV
jgi:isoquinoline 1-oxidoreductase beta subunit